MKPPPPLNAKTKPRESSPALSEQRFREKPRPRPLRFNIADTILYHDNGVAVVNKPAGLVTQSYTKRNEADKQLVKNDVFTQYLKKVGRRLNHNGNLYPVHRLDMDTTGALLLGLTEARTRDLSAQFRNRTVKKTYLALVRGGIDAFSSISGQIREPIFLRDGQPVHHSRANARCEMKEAATDWELLGSSSIAPLSVLKLKLLTGYKHQLRVHLAHRLNTPIFGDALYSPKTGSVELARVVTHSPERMFLHSAELGIHRYRSEGPTKGKRYELNVCAPLPSDFLQVCRQAQIVVPEHFVVGGTFEDGKRIEPEPIPFTTEETPREGVVGRLQ
ncbi:pseudouridine synthase [Schizophyllum commune Tattone D]|nr:pseudouridine synthase [Schizophyllum commune Tattone D]